ncbi:hypothetical protein [Aquabacter spiritensis]|uniref:Uncharacterized protein n=1 Tax=Aquabacter spiritensis TaxID=933073 RepID=A0A4R3M0U8_9HYPH|nr:hypothetical protein [Aquabacter spiritensis]TCT06711.1 hypothetical protein EDC64_102190 [Aquabacter spiritensis]
MAAPFSFAPENLYQPINPWEFFGSQFGFFNVIIGDTPRPDLEKTILKDVGSYGRQIGRIGEALQVIMRHMDHSKLTEPERRALVMLEAQLLEIENIKSRASPR